MFLFFAASNSNNLFFTSIPPENPPSEPAEPMTRCQGMMIGTGFAPRAFPTARAAFGLPILPAIQA
jgi:hypothetical protein